MHKTLREAEIKVEAADPASDIEIFINHILAQIRRLRDISDRMGSISIRCYGPPVAETEVNNRMEPSSIAEKLRDLDAGLEIVASELELHASQIENFI